VIEEISENIKALEQIIKELESPGITQEWEWYYFERQAYYQADEATMRGATGAYEFITPQSPKYNPKVYEEILVAAHYKAMQDTLNRYEI